MQKKINKSNSHSTETGRSMMEMLGVLAVMGVLSVGGTAMYTSAMNKHKANELLNEASKRATSAATQFIQGKEKAFFNEFQNNLGFIEFNSETSTGDNENQFKITLKKIPNTNICSLIKSQIGSNSPFRKINDSCSEISFNKDLSTTKYPSDFNHLNTCTDAGYSWCGAETNPLCSTNCCNNKTVGECQICDKSSGAVLVSPANGNVCGNNGICQHGTCYEQSNEENCIDGGPYCNDNTYGKCCPAGYTCTTNGDTVGTCKKFTSGCTTNADCTDTNKHFCMTRSNANSMANSGGTCTAMNGNYQPLPPVSVVGLGNVVMSSGPLNNWWSARNWCLAQNKNLINIEDFNAYKNGEILMTTNSNNGGIGCADGKQCVAWNNNGMWNENVLTATGETLKNNYSPILLNLAKIFRGTRNVFWTASDYNNSSTFAFRCNLTVGGFGNVGRGDPGTHALCK